MAVIIKEMNLPKTCYDCNFCRHYDEPNQGYYCILLFADLHRTEFTKKRIDACPLIEQKCGKWLNFNDNINIPEDTPLYDFLLQFPHWECSICGYKYVAMDIEDKPHNFCPFCGATMNSET